MADSRWGMFPVPSLIINNVIMTSPLLSQVTHVLANLLIFSETLLFKGRTIRKVIGGWGEGNFRAAEIFFRYQISCMNFFRP